MSDPFVGEILLFPCNFPPKNFAFCRGQLVPIQQNTALFSLLGTIYGGNGVTTFALPNLQGRVPIGSGQGPGLADYEQGQAGGVETAALTTAAIPQHSHAIAAGSVLSSAACRSTPGNQQTPVGNVPATESTGVTATYSGAAPTGTMRAGSIAFSGTATAAATGGGQAHENRQPFLALNYCIALTGVFPPRP